MSSKCDLQNTQTAPLAAVCTPTIKLVQQNHQKTRNLVKNVCVKLALCFFLSISLFSPPHSPSDSVFYPSFPASGHNRILLCFSGMCQNPVMLFRESIPSESAMGSVRVCACLRLAAPVCTFSGTECSFVWTAPLSDIRRLGTPKRHTIFFHTKCCTLCAVICATGSASIHLVKYSMATIKYFICLIASGKGPRMSSPHVWKGHGLYMDRNSSCGALCQSACFWHCLHRWACRAQSYFTVGQKKPARITLEAKDLPPTWLPRMPSCSSAIILVHSSPLTHVRIG